MSTLGGEEIKSSNMPRLWRHKTTNKECRAMPWWECLDPIMDEKFIDLDKGRKYKIGTLVQIGWLLENEHGVWMGVNLTAEPMFEDLGEAPKPKETQDEK